ncbi:ABC transporter permease subunit [Antarcticirhabdus aurantiaca]|uniref:ABC transporter permease subunit n=1 Tax=Antarcticirhabdus aurantiaca TaxID=2606717 RepID=A0ACD4NLK1_9HYPH|nr:ABC transporter permease subunit [Antarcticirhabdus aurantiaca]WAJ27662.1 ABC transporter permease subunit [Jeongeuplla avenae]
MAGGDRALSPAGTVRRGAAGGAEARDRHVRLGLGLAASLLLAGLLGGAFLVLLLTSDAVPDPLAVLADPYLRAVTGFTLLQAGLSALLSVAGGVPLGLALHRTRFAGRALVLRLLLLPQVLPVLVGALGIVAVWGFNGLVSDALAALGLARINVYGLAGILLAHAFFNLPLVARMVVGALDGVPAERWKLAGQLGLGRLATFRIVEAPALRAVLPGAFGLVFMLCATSFTLVLVLGGGPAASTLQVAIYKALSLDFAAGNAVALCLVQVSLTALVLLALSRLPGREAGGFTLGAAPRRYDRPSRLASAADTAVLFLGLLFVGAPFAAILLGGLGSDLGPLLANPAVHRATLTSLVVGLCAASLAVLLSLALLAAGRERPGSAFEIGPSLVLVVPPVVVGAGWFLVLRQVTDVYAAAPYVVVATNAAMSVPFVTRIVGPALAAAHAGQDRLARSLGLFGLARWRLVDWPAARRPLTLAFAFAFALSLGDLGAIALFGSPDFQTLPFLLYQRLGSYRSTDGEGLALLLGVVCLALMLLAERGAAPSVRRPLA